MDKIIKRSIDLGLAVYRVTEKFPEEEILRRRLREISVGLIEVLCYYRWNPTPKGGFFNCPSLDEGIEKFRRLAEIAKMQGWVSPANFDVLTQEYIGLSQDLKTQHNKILEDKHNIGSEEKPEVKTLIESTNAKTLKRQGEIMSLLNKRKNPISINEFAEHMHTSTKTVERHLKRLVYEGKVLKHGNTRNAKYLKT